MHRPGHLDYVGVKHFNAAGEVTGETRFLGLYTHTVYAENAAQAGVTASIISPSPNQYYLTINSNNTGAQGQISISDAGSGTTLGTYLRESLAGPAGIDFFIGLPAEFDARCAELIPPGPPCWPAGPRDGSAAPVWLR